MTAAPFEKLQALQDTLEAHAQAKRWTDAVAALMDMAEADTEASARARYLQAAALIFRDELCDVGRAALLLQAALDEDPSCAGACDRLAKLPPGAAPDEALRACYGRALARLSSDGPAAARAQLWAALGLLLSGGPSKGPQTPPRWSAPGEPGGSPRDCLHRLGDRQTAIAALEAAQALDEDPDRDRLLTELAAAEGSAAAGTAIAAQQRMAARAPMDPGSYRALARLWADAGDGDRLPWALAALRVLGAEPQLPVTEPPPTWPPPSDTTRLTDGVWARLIHPDEDARVAARLCTDLLPVGAPAWRAFRLEYGPSLAPHQTDTRAALVSSVCRFFGVPEPALFLGQQAEPLTAYDLWNNEEVIPALMLDQHFFATAPRGECAFLLARAVALLRPPWRLRFSWPVAGPSRAARLSLWSAPGEGGRLPTRPADSDLARWLALADLGSTRAALLFTGDLAAATAVIAREPACWGRLAPEERMKDLLGFCVSEDHFAARRALAAGGRPPGPAETR